MPPQSQAVSEESPIVSNSPPTRQHSTRMAPMHAHRFRTIAAVLKIIETVRLVVNRKWCSPACLSLTFTFLAGLDPRPVAGGEVWWEGRQPHVPREC